MDVGVLPAYYKLMYTVVPYTLGSFRLANADKNDMLSCVLSQTERNNTGCALRRISAGALSNTTFASRYSPRPLRAIPRLLAVSASDYAYRKLTPLLLNLPRRGGPSPPHQHVVSA